MAVVCLVCGLFLTACEAPISEVDITEEVQVGEEIENLKEQIIESQGYTVSVRGPSGFDTQVLRINAGDQVIFANNDPREKDMVLTFQKDRTPTFFNSDITPYHATYTHTFDEAGVYDYWVLGYGVKAAIVVS